MAFNISPSVKITERDLSNVVGSVATSIAAVVGRAKKGPAFKRLLNPNDQRLVENYGAPDDNSYKPFFSALGYLSQGQNLYYTRVTGVDSKCSTVHLTLGDSATTQTSGSDGEAILVPGSGSSAGFDPDEAADTIGNTADMDFVAVGPGTYYHDYYLSIINAEDYATLSNPVSGAALFAISTTSGGYENHEYLTDLDVGPQGSDEFAVFVLTDEKETGATTPVYTVQESYLVSMTAGKKDGDGKNMYVENRINENSGIVRVRVDSNKTTAPKTLLAAQFSGGTDEAASTASYQYGWDLYKNPEVIDVNILIDADSNDTIKAYLNSICELRKDCVSLLDVPYAQYNDGSVSTTINNIVSYVDNTLGLDSSYSAIYANYFKVYDKYNEKERWVPASGFVAGLLAATDYNNDAWFPVAGINRGVINGIRKIKLETAQADRDSLYSHRVNPIVNFRGGAQAVVWGQKTLYNKSSSFNRLNVRRLFIVLEKSIATYAEQIIFEFNDEFTRNLFTSLIEPFLVDVQNRRGIYDFKVVVDETNNTAEVIDANGFVADIYIKPTRAAEFINLNFYSTRTGQNFDELIGG